MTSTFRLLHLPLVVLCNVFDQFHLDAIVTLLFCSKRTMHLTKFLMKNDPTKVKIEVLYDSSARVDLSKVRVKDTVSEKWQIERDVVEYSSVTILNCTELPTEFEMVKVGDQDVPAIKDPKQNYQVYYEEMFDGLKKVLEHFIPFFEVPIDCLNLASDIHPNQIRSMIDWTLTKQSSIKYVYIECDITSDDALSDILRVSHFIKDLSINVKPRKEFRHYFIFENDSIGIYKAYWIVLNNLLSMNCRVCQLTGTNLTCQEMNQFLKHWINGGFTKTMYFRIGLKSRSFPEILADLNAVYVEDERHFIKDDYYFVVKSGYDIQGNNGRAATIIEEEERLNSDVFRMVVW